MLGIIFRRKSKVTMCVLTCLAGLLDEREDDDDEEMFEQVSEDYIALTSELRTNQNKLNNGRKRTCQKVSGLAMAVFGVLCWTVSLVATIIEVAAPQDLNPHHTGNSTSF